MNLQPYILWLPSWYPNERRPYDGDFIQRHAKAASLHNPITVIYFTQYGETIKSDYKIVERIYENLKEVIVYVPFRPLGLWLLDRVVYNIFFYRFSKKILKNYFKENGSPSLVHVHVPMKSGNLALWIKRKFSIPYIVSEHASTYMREAPDNFYQRHFLYRWQVRNIFSKAIAVTNVSNAVGKILCELFNVKRLTVIHNVVDTSLFKWVSLQKDHFTYIHVSSLNDQKNIFGILRAFKKLSDIRRDWRLIVVGPYTTEIERFVEQQKLSDLICLTGEIPYVEVAKHMQQAHVLVLFSKHENFPCVVIEALCCGLPVISSDVAGIKEAVNSSNGILVQSENEEALLRALLKIREVYHAYHPSSIAAVAESKFSYSAIARRFDELYYFKHNGENIQY